MVPSLLKYSSLAMLRAARRWGLACCVALAEEGAAPTERALGAYEDAALRAVVACGAPAMEPARASCDVAIVKVCYCWFRTRARTGARTGTGEQA